MTKDEELRDSYSKLEAAELQITRMNIELTKINKVIRLLVVAGFITDEKVDEAKALIFNAPNDV